MTDCASPIAVIGAGPSGLTAAYELCKAGVPPVVLEMSDQVGGISRTETYKGYRFDIGGHRFFTKVGEVEALWHEILGDDFIEVKRLSRIYYDGRFFDYPLNLWDTLGSLGPWESFKILGSYLKAKLREPYPETNLENWVINRFGARLYHMFFKTYTEKVWGIPCDQIRADWAAQRIKNLSVKRAVRKALVGGGSETSLINEFHYPRKGPGMMWERCTEHVRRMGGDVRMNTEVTRIRHESNPKGRHNGQSNGSRRVQSVETRGPSGDRQAVAAEHVINSMPITHLVQRLDPAPPAAVLEAADDLDYRDFLIVALIIDAEDLFPDNWIYIHSPEVKVGRIQNFKNWSPEMVPDASKTCLGMEYFCNKGDGLWTSQDADLIAMGERELRAIGLADGAEVIDGTVIRQKHTYPVYDATYKENLAVIRDYLDTIENLQTVGRAGMHRYNNQDHSMLTALLAAKNILGEEHDVWDVNVERSYHEDFQVEEQQEAVERAQNRTTEREAANVSA